MIDDETMRKLVSDNYECVTGLFYYGNLPYDEIEVYNGQPIAKVRSNKFDSLSKIKAFLSEVYCSKEVEQLIYNYNDEGPLYFERDGELYLNVELTTNAGMLAPWEKFDIQLISETEKGCKFYACVKFANEETRYKFSFAALFQDKWKLTKVVWKPDIKW